MIIAVVASPIEIPRATPTHLPADTVKQNMICQLCILLSDDQPRI